MWEPYEKLKDTDNFIMGTHVKDRRPPETPHAIGSGAVWQEQGKPEAARKLQSKWTEVPRRRPQEGDHTMCHHRRKSLFFSLIGC